MEEYLIRRFRLPTHKTKKAGHIIVSTVKLQDTQKDMYTKEYLIMILSPQGNVVFLSDLHFSKKSHILCNKEK